MAETGTTRVSSSSSCFSWSELPTELLRIIASKISSAFDFIRFRSVCKSWRSAADPADIPPSPPLLLLPHDPSSAKRTFFSLTTRTSRTFHDLDELRGKTICGSAYGWLALVGHPRTGILSLWNPLTGTHIPLPPVTGPLNPAPPRLYIPKKVFLSSKPKPRPDDHDDCVVVITIMHYRGIAFCRPRDGKEAAWTYLDDLGLWTNPASIVFHEGSCFVFDRFGAGAVVDLGNCPPTSRNVVGMSPALCVDPRTFYGVVQCLAMRSFVLKTEEGIFVVVHRGLLNGFATSESPSSSSSSSSLQKSVRFFKLDATRGGFLRWAEVDKIGDDLAVFLAWNHASVFDAGASQGCMKNCIYIGTTHLYNHTMTHPRGGVIFMDILGIMGEESHQILEEAVARARARTVAQHWMSEYTNNSTWFTPTF